MFLIILVGLFALQLQSEAELQKLADYWISLQNTALNLKIIINKVCGVDKRIL